MNFREGDIVQLSGKISHCNATDEEVRVDVGEGEYLYTKPAGVRLVTPQIEPGDTVKLKDPVGGQPFCSATVLAISADHLWVEWGEGNYSTWWIGAVDRVAIAGTNPEGGDA